MIGQVHRDFNDGEPIVMSQAKQPLTDNPHLEIKTQYLYGQEVDTIWQQKTVVAMVSANKISKPSRRKLSNSGVVYAENVKPDDLSEFISE